jgi:hypothetical protein
MSSQLTTFVPVLDGTNYQQWASQMQSYLMSQGQWKCTRGAPAPELKHEKDGKTVGTATQEDVDSWDNDCERALGNIRLRLHHTIGSQYGTTDHPADLWDELKEKYGSPGMTRAFVEFKGAMDTVIPNGSDPSPALDKILAHFTILQQMKWDIPQRIQAMIILAKAPSNMEAVVQVMAQNSAQRVEEDETAEPLKLDDVLKAMRLSWETGKRSGASKASGSGQNQQRANKLSAVQRSGAPPQFTQQQQPYQQQQRDDGSGYRGQGRGRGRRGKREDNVRSNNNNSCSKPRPNNIRASIPVLRPWYSYQVPLNHLPNFHNHRG